jgi:hypothetical protein
VSIKPEFWGSIGLVGACLTISLLSSVVPRPRGEAESCQAHKQETGA